MRRVTPRKIRSPKAKYLSSPTIFRCPVLGLVAAVFLSGCTVVVGRRPPPPPTPTKVVRPIEVYGTPAPTFAPTPEATPTAAPLPTPSPAPAPTATEPPPTPTATPPPVVIYLVQQGDTLSEIAAAYGVPLSAIVEANSITDPGKLTVGEQLVIPSATDATPVAPPAATATLPPAPVAATAASVPTLELIASPTAPPATATATPAPPPLPTAQPQWPQISESSVSINIIEYEKALFPLRPEDVGYPYDGLDQAKVGPPVPRQYRALVLENAYLAVTIVPDLGGRIYQITDKLSGRQLLYNNPAVIASTWGMRGWWLAIGGVEWSLPTEEHGLVEYLPWAASVAHGDAEASVLLSIGERLTGVACQIRVSLDADHAYVKIAPTFSNPGDVAQKLQFWINAMFAPSGVRVPSNTRLVFPSGQIVVHNTSDPGLPPAGSVMSWPSYGPRDLSLLDDWHGFLGAFAYPRAQAGFMGAQTGDSSGLLRVFPPDVAQGAKFFGLGDIPYTRYSQADSSYLELWGGWTPSFWAYQELGPGQTVQWQESWYPLPPMPPVTAANSEVALALTGDSLAVLATRTLEAEIEAFAGQERSLQLWRADLTPGQIWRPAELPQGITAIEVRDRRTGQKILRWPG